MVGLSNWHAAQFCQYHNQPIVLWTDKGVKQKEQLHSQ